MATDDAAAAAGPGFGAAAGSLSDPACKPGTTEFAAAEQRNNELLERYNNFKAEFERKQQVRAALSAAGGLLLLAALSLAKHTPNHKHYQPQQLCLPSHCTALTYRSRQRGSCCSARNSLSHCHSKAAAFDAGCCKAEIHSFTSYGAWHTGMCTGPRCVPIARLPAPHTPPSILISGGQAKWVAGVPLASMTACCCREVGTY